MTNLFNFLLIFLGTIYLCLEFSTIIVYGPFLKNQDVFSYIEKRKFTINQFNSDILSSDIYWHDDKSYKELLKTAPDYISINSLSFFSKYHICNEGKAMGRVFRWSKGHYEIEKIYKSLIQPAHDVDGDSNWLL